MTSKESTSRHGTTATKGRLFPDNSISVLHVDDEEDFLELTRVFMKEVSTESTSEAISIAIDSIASSEEIMERIKKNNYDVIISDYEMPSLNGLQLLELVRKESDIPFIILTGRGREEVAIKALNLGANYYIRKSQDPRVLYQELLVVLTSLAKYTRTKLALKQSMMYHLLLFENSPACSLFIEKGGSIVNTNRSLPRILGYEREEMLGKQFLDFVDIEERDWINRKIDSAFNGVEGPNSVFTLIAKSGEKVNILYSGKHVMSPNGMLITGI
ncbi:MAG: response regulator, partial [Candidatus Odinarchaeota archaeon]